MSQLGFDENVRQELLEMHLANLGVALALLEHDAERVRTAIESHKIDALLAPVLEDSARIRAAIITAQQQMGQIWAVGQEIGWKP